MAEQDSVSTVVSGPTSSPSGIRVFEKEGVISEIVSVYIRVVKFPGGSALVYVGEAGTQRGILNDLSLSLGSTATTIINNCTMSDDVVNTTSQSLAKKLSSKYNDNRPVYVSFNIKPEVTRNADHLLLLNRLIADAMKESSSMA